MGSRGIQVALIAVVIVFGVVAAAVVNGARHPGQTATNTTTPSPLVEASPSESPSASPSAAASPSPEASPAPAATAAPSPVPTPTTTTSPTTTPTTTPTGTGSGSSCSTGGSGGSGPPGYPQQVSAGAQYAYCGPRALVVHATDRDNGSGVCAGINENTQAFPSGYEGVFFVGVQFPDGQIISAGYVRTAAGRQDFGSIQNASGSQKSGQLGADPGAGSHTYCVKRGGSGWIATRDSTTIFSTPNEPAANFNGGVVKFDNDVEPVGAPAAASFTLVVPGFHDILVDGRGPRELRGAAFYS